MLVPHGSRSSPLDSSTARRRPRRFQARGACRHHPLRSSLRGRSVPAAARAFAELHVCPVYLPRH